MQGKLAAGRKVPAETIDLAGFATRDAAPVNPEWTRETRLWRNANFRWFDGVDALAQAALEKAFHEWLAIAEDGRACLSNSVNWAYVRIEGPLFRIVSLDPTTLVALLSNGQSVEIDPEDLRVSTAGMLYAYANVAARVTWSTGSAPVFRVLVQFSGPAATSMADVIEDKGESLQFRSRPIAVMPDDELSSWRFS